MIDSSAIKYIAIVFCIFLLANCITPSGSKEEILIIVPETVKTNEGCLLAIKNLESVLNNNGFEVKEHTSSDKLPDKNKIIIGKVKPEMGESYTISSAKDANDKTLNITGGSSGLMYGIFKLADEISIGRNFWEISMEMTPDFPRRIYAEQGQLFNLPSVGYHLFKPPWVNNERFEKEKAEMKKLIDETARLGFNSLCILHNNFEDYINYKYLDKEIYTPEDVHWKKSKLFAHHLNDIIDYAHRRHIEVFLQVYEFQYPPRLEELYDIDLGLPEMENIINAKVRELFEVTQLDGLIITATESAPRSGYKSKEPWRDYGLKGAGKMMNMYHNAAKKSGKTVIFRSWLIAFGAKDSEQVLEKIPADAQFEIKHTGTDFWLNMPLTDAITGGLGKKRPLTITFDVFPQYYGWSRLICYLKRISKEARIAKENGVKGIQAWAAWSPGCIWNDGHPGYTPEGKLQDSIKEFYDMAGPWNDFRIFTRGFTPGQMNAYQLGRIAWDTSLTAEEIARDWGAIHFGKENAAYIADALMKSQDAFREFYPQGAWDFPFFPTHLTWATPAILDDIWMGEVYKGVSVSDILQSNQAAYSYLQLMKRALLKIDESKVPDQEVYAKFMEGFKKTELYISLYMEARELWIRERDINAEHDILKVPDWLRRDFCKVRLEEIIEEWQKYPEAKFWGINKKVFFEGRDYSLSPTEVLRKFDPAVLKN